MSKLKASPLSDGHRPFYSELSSGALLARLFNLAWDYKWLASLLILLQLVLVAFELGAVNFASAAIDYVELRHSKPGEDITLYLGFRDFTFPHAWNPMHVIIWLSVGVLVASALRGLLHYTTIFTSAKLAQRIVVRLRRQVYDKLQRLSFRFFDANESGSIINRVTGDVQQVRMFVDQVLIQLITIVVTLSMYIIFMVKISWKLTLLCLITVPVMVVAACWFAWVVRPLFRLGREKLDDTIRVLSESIQGMHVVKCFNRQGDQINRFGHANQSVHDTRRKVFWRQSIFIPSMNLLAQINLMVLLIVGGRMVFMGTLDLGLLLVFSYLLRDFANRVQMVANVTNSIQMSLTGAQRVFEVMDAPIEINSKPDAIDLEEPKGSVTFDNLSFRYETGDDVLSNISFEVAPGECVAILGATGAGKSTLLSLIPRFYDASEGRLLVDGVDVRDLELDDLRRSVGTVFQENFLFSTTVAANIAFGHPDASREQVEKAAHISAAHDFISKMKDGYDTMIGENGVDLSGGQRQRIAIARAVLLEPKILLLDDATSAIDPETEHEILAAMDNAMKGRTTFVVAHRLSTLRRADKVVVLEKGRIVQVGTHDELMHTKGHYRRAAKVQVADEESKRLLGLHPDQGEVA